jgi:hypothetical protein
MTVSNGATVVGTSSVTAVNGVADFTNVGISGTAGNTYTLTFASTTPTVLASETQQIPLAAGPAAQLVITTLPVAGPSGAPFSTPPVIQIRDAQGNLVTSDNSTQVTVAISSGAGGTLGGTLTQKASGGVVRFNDLTLAGVTDRTYGLTFSAPILTSTTASVKVGVVVSSVGPATNTEGAVQPALIGPVLKLV